MKAFTFVGVCLALACSPPNVGNSDPNAACTDFAYVRCTHLNACSPTYMQLRYGVDDGNVARCESLATANCVASLAAPSTGTSPAGVEACSVAESNWVCSDFIELLNPPPSCVTAKGSRAIGAPCAFSSQCETSYCAVMIGAACGTCAPLPAAGDSCANFPDCGSQDGLLCETATEKCTPFGLSGATCTNAPCNGGAALACGNATCQPTPTTAGAPCVSTGPGCAFVAGLACNSVSNTCANLQMATYGQACGILADQSVTCGGDAMCVGAVGNTPGTCSFVAALGAPCDIANGPSCMNPSRCIVTSDAGTGGTCQIPNASTCL